MIRKFLIIFLLLCPFSVKALDIDNFKYDGNIVYDLSDSYTDSEELVLSKDINNFIKVSNIDLVVITIDNKNSYDNLYNIFKEDKNFGKGLYKDGIVIIYKKMEKKVDLIYTGEGFLENISFVRFRKKYYNKYVGYIGNEKIVSNIIDEWTNYYIIKDIFIIILIIGLSLMFTFMVLKIIKVKYDIVKVDNAYDYYSDNEVEILDKEE